MSVFHDEVEIEDFEYDEDTETYFYPCPCGDQFQITKVRVDHRVLDRECCATACDGFTLFSSL